MGKGYDEVCVVEFEVVETDAATSVTEIGHLGQPSPRAGDVASKQEQILRQRGHQPWGNMSGDLLRLIRQLRQEPVVASEKNMRVALERSRNVATACEEDSCHLP